MPNSPTWGLRLPALNGETPDVPAAMLRLAVDLESTLAARGLFADKPTSSIESPGKPGRRWFATDHRMEYLDTGTGWIPVGPAYIGDYKMAARTDDHDTWLRCEGRELAATYTDLIAMLTNLGRPFGVGPNGRPRLPDPAGRALVFAGQGGGLSNRPLGEVGGQEQHTLTEAQLPSHNHGGGTGSMNRNAAHDHPLTTTNQIGVLVNGRYGNGDFAGIPRADGGYGWISNDGHTGLTDTNHEHGIAPSGSNQPHPNMQPYAAVAYLFIRA
jgi:microcystin-dependent protein